MNLPAELARLESIAWQRTGKRRRNVRRLMRRYNQHVQLLAAGSYERANKVDQHLNYGLPKEHHWTPTRKLGKRPAFNE